MKLLECYEPENKQNKIATVLLYMITEAQYTEKKAKENELPPVSLHGSLILQDLLKFKKPIKVRYTYKLLNIIYFIN